MTPHFTLAEFMRSDTALARHIDNSLPAFLVPVAGETLAMLERIRAHLSAVAGRDVPISISSGYRCPALNWAVRKPRAGPGVDAGGDHPRAMAVDWTAPRFGRPLEICRELAPLVGQLGIGQLIYEGTWIHTSTALPSRAVNRIITLMAGGGYAPGIVVA